MSDDRLGELIAFVRPVDDEEALARRRATLPCTDNQATFLSTDRADVERAKALCGRCPRLDRCRERTATIEPKPACGVWAGVEWGIDRRPVDAREPRAS